ncbi:hypothetical protein HanIR_Chr05g0239671 [Helianthus annuus]|nr:hypothetical protein HanIR_Chr05g0239671 [Helianthus annuus]
MFTLFSIHIISRKCLDMLNINSIVLVGSAYLISFNTSESVPKDLKPDSSIPHGFLKLYITTSSSE